MHYHTLNQVRVSALLPQSLASWCLWGEQEYISLHLCSCTKDEPQISVCFITGTITASILAHTLDAGSEITVQRRLWNGSRQFWLAPGLARRVLVGWSSRTRARWSVARRITHQGVKRVGLVSCPCNTRVAARQHTLAVDELSTDRG